MAGMPVVYDFSLRDLCTPLLLYLLLTSTPSHTHRFPIGKTEQVKTWPADALKTFWNKWYFPANTTLYIVGDLDRCA